MKDKLIYLIATLICAIHVSGCSRNDSIASVSAPTFEKEIKSDSVQLLDVRTPQEYADGHSEIAGVYEDSNDGSSLIVRKGNDGKYNVEINLIRLTQLEGEGELTDNGLEFSATDAAGNPIYGAVYIKDNSAKLTITKSTWDYLPEGTSYKFDRK